MNVNTNQSTLFSAGCLILTLNFELLHVSFNILNDPVVTSILPSLWWVFRFDIIALNM